MIESALYYREKLNFSIIPIIPRKKKPLIKWEKYQKELPAIDEVKEWWTKTPNANIGIVTGKINNLAVIDFDKHKPEYSEEIALEYFPENIETPTVLTPSGGLHLYFKYPTKQELTNNTGILPAIDLRANGGYIIAPPSMNSKKKQYEWIDGLHISEVKLNSIPNAYYLFLNNTSTSIYNNSKNHAKKLQLFKEGRRDEDLFHLANTLIKGRMLEDEVYQYLEFIAKNCNPPYPQKDISSKIKSALKRTEKHEKNLSHEIREFVLSTDGYFLSKDVYFCLSLSTRKEKKLCSKVLSDLAKDKIIERIGSKNGNFRLIDYTAPDIDLYAPKKEFLDLKFPLDLHSYFRAMPKNIIVIAGTQDSGKTAFLLRFAVMNMNRGMDIRYQTSEMGTFELQDRLEMFEDVPLEDWKKVNFKENSSNFQDYILPDGINIIDYLEITDNFYKIGAELKKIHDRLKDGIAIIGLQKDFKTDLGRGGTFSSEKPRLYISLTSNPPEGGIAKIVKCKNWVNKRVNPNHRECSFRIRDGNEIRQITRWDYPKR